MKITGLKIFAAVVTIFVVTAIVMAFVVVGSPSQERARRMDQQRSSDLQQLSWSVNNYYSQYKTLPEKLEELRTTPEVYLQSAADPQTGALYEYHKTGDTAYEVCATFETVQTGNDLGGTGRPVTKGLPDPFYSHDVGRKCIPQKVVPSEKAGLVK